MDLGQFGISAVPLHNSPYGPLLPEHLAGSNKGKVAIVKGAAQGIGKKIAEALANSGANVAIVDLKDGSETKTACESFNVKAACYSCDVTDVERMRTVVEDIEKVLGPIDILVKNAGMNRGRPICMDTFEGYWRCFEVNYKSVMNCIFAVLPGMRERKSGTIISMASRAGTHDCPLALGYTDSKTAIIRATASIQGELEMDGLGETIQMFSLHPGGVPTALGSCKYILTRSYNYPMVNQWPPVPGSEEGLQYQSAGFPADVAQRYPEAEKTMKQFLTYLRTDPGLCAMTCAYLATGRGKQLRGMYLDVRQDIGRVAARGRSALQKAGLYSLKMDFIEDYANEV
ncbi:hypothetical protein LTR10_020554 [Elasticomyces elasticus]|uniref:NAD(P)-binding protein n=1 Tax=Exophiala sideris TaxID=1016849 RepID=A0ABR0JKZ3_9EURO|nr:hypothetical protein LTR10_020554 [Elasticomyces elasticus]KAK5035408.1 hypothetical protein LTS07_002845 [Exophiala sideris]KAK5039241.1 hypothetical protein LTR13_003497 [Exophiala sideris]KAK5066332.1 hypothetical protein LTR69_002851 [Exophiala sideris]KAK5187009.1 hypothetical protein LTR44_001016 [Eurotiomycetes sp. CCFEE 6388]